MNEEIEKGVVGDEAQEGSEYVMDATGAMVRQETIAADKEFDNQTGSDWREQK
jgi:hypothetical protein